MHLRRVKLAESDAHSNPCKRRDDQVYSLSYYCFTIFFLFWRRTNGNGTKARFAAKFVWQGCIYGPRGYSALFACVRLSGAVHNLVSRIVDRQLSPACAALQPVSLLESIWSLFSLVNPKMDTCVDACAPFFLAFPLDE